MSQATLGSAPYRNSNPFSGYYLEERVDGLEAKIQRTDDLIDETVYDLYGLTEEEIAVVDGTVGE
jgi:type II restriction/modification system DNA methylase subunit YeeA